MGYPYVDTCRYMMKILYMRGHRRANSAGMGPKSHSALGLDPLHSTMVEKFPQINNCAIWVTIFAIWVTIFARL